MTTRPVRIVVLLLAALAITFSQSAQATPPALVVVVVIDQFRGDYLAAFRDHFGEDGFNRVMREGAWFSNAHLQYGSTATGPGHATMLTGVPPAVHGIVANDWQEFSGKAHGVYCCGDGEAKCIGLPEGARSDGRSPRNLRAATLGDALKAALGAQSKVWTIAIKDRAAVLTGGQHADCALWFDDGNFVTSSYYRRDLPEWAAQFNRERFADRYFHKPWDRLLPAALYGPRFVVAPGGDGRSADDAFPKIIGGDREKPDKKYFDELINTPFGNELVFEAARRCIAAEELGGDGVTDLLCLGCSSNDVVGHTYGPDSDEVMDCTLRTDRQLGEFLNWLDARLGRGNYLLAITADHGVAPMPELAQAAGLGGGRIDTGDLKKALNRGLAERFPDASEPLVAEVNLPWIYLNEQAVAAAHLEQKDVARAAARLAADFPGIERTVPICDLPADIDGRGDELLDQVRNSYFAGRAGHVYAHWNRYWYKGRTQAGHGAAYDYDQHVPILLMGPGIRAGRYSEPVRPTAMVATICAALDIKPPNPQCTPPLAPALAPAPVAASATTP